MNISAQWVRLKKNKLIEIMRNYKGYQERSNDTNGASESIIIPNVIRIKT